MADSAPNNLQANALLPLLMSGQSGGLDLGSLLAAQAGGDQTGGLDLGSLLAAQAGGGADGEPGADRLSLALRWIEQQRAAAAQSAPAEETPSEAELELQRLEEMRHQREQREQARELKKMMKDMYAELETLRARNDTLAAALGACYLCFGEDLTCPACNGRGRPGALIPDAAAFRQYVAPAVHRVRATPPRTPGGLVPRMGQTYQIQSEQPIPNAQPPAATR